MAFPSLAQFLAELRARVRVLFSFTPGRWLKSWLASSARTHVKRPRYRLFLEPLETRLAPANRVWDGGGANNLWSNPLNWDGAGGGTLPNFTGVDNLTFPASIPAGPERNITNDIVNARCNIFSIGDDSFTFGGTPLEVLTRIDSSGVPVGAEVPSAINFNVVLGTGTVDFRLTSGSPLIVNGSISGAVGTTMRKMGTGQLTLTGDNSGLLSKIQVGDLTAADDGVLEIRPLLATAKPLGPDLGQNTTVRTGSQLLINVAAAVSTNFTFAEHLSLDGAGFDGALMNISPSAVTVNWTGTVTLAGNTTISAGDTGQPSGGLLVINGVISETGGQWNLTKVGPSRLRLEPLNAVNGNTYTGQTFVNGGILAIGHPFALGVATLADATNALKGTVVNHSSVESGTLSIEYTNNPNVVFDAAYENYKPLQTLTLTGLGTNFEFFAGDDSAGTYTPNFLNNGTDATAIAALFNGAASSTVGGIGGTATVVETSLGVFEVTFGGNLAGLGLPLIDVEVVTGTGTADVQSDLDDVVAGFKVPFELLTLNGWGSPGISAVPRAPGTQLAGAAPATDVIGTLQSGLGENSWAANINLWSSNGELGIQSTGWTTGPFAKPDAIALGALSGTSLTINGTIDDPFVTLPHTLVKVGRGRVIFTHENDFSGEVAILQGVLNIRDSRALGEDTNIDPIWNQTTLELQADEFQDSVTGGFDLHIPLGTITNGNTMGLVGAGAFPTAAFNVGAIHNISGSNIIDADLFMGTTTPSLNASSASIGVDADPDPFNDQGNSWNNLSQLTINGNVRGVNLTKLGLGELVLTRANSYSGRTNITAGWITIRDDETLGVLQPALAETVQPLTEVFNGAALHLKQNLILEVQNVNLPATASGGATQFRLTFNGHTTVPILYDTSGDVTAERIKAALDDLPNIGGVGGYVTVTRNVAVNATVFQVTFRGALAGVDVPTLTGVITAAPPAAGTVLTVGVVTEGRTNDMTFFENLILAGTGIPRHRHDWLEGQGALLNLGGENVSTGKIELNGLTLLSPTPVGIGVELDGALQPFPPISQLTTRGTISDFAGTTGALNKLGTMRLVIQGDGTYHGNVDIQNGVLRVASDSGLGTARDTTTNTTTTVQAGTALELAPTLPELSGGIQAGLEIHRERLILEGTGNSTFGAAPISIVSDDNVWRGPISLTPSVTITFLADTTFAEGIDFTSALAGTIETKVTTARGSGVDAVHTITFGGVIAEGSTFTLIFDNGTTTQQTGNINFSLTPSVLAANIQAALNTLFPAVNTLVETHSPLIDIFPNTRFIVTGVIDDDLSSMNNGADLFVLGSGELHLANANTYDGTTFVGSDAGTRPFNGVLTISDGAALGNGSISEVQQLNLASATSATFFTLTFDDGRGLAGSVKTTTPAIDYTADTNGTTDAGLIAAALNALTNIGGVTGTVTVQETSPTSNVFTITFMGNLDGFDQNPLTVVKTAGPGTLAPTTITTTDGAGGTIVVDGAQLQMTGGIDVNESLRLEGEGTLKQPEVQTVTLGGARLGTAFTLVFDGSETDPLTFGATAAQVEQAVNDLDSVDLNGGIVNVYWTSPNTYTFIFRGDFNGLNQTEIMTSTGTAEVQTLRIADAFFPVTQFTLTSQLKPINGAVDSTTAPIDIVITSPDHGLANGQTVTVRNVLGNTAANGTFTVATNGGQVLSASDGDGVLNNWIVINTTVAHGLVDGDRVTIDDVQGATSGANGTWTIDAVTPLSFRLVGAIGNGSVNNTGIWFDADRFTLVGSLSNGTYTGGGFWTASGNIFGASNPGQVVITTTATHGLRSGAEVTVSQVLGNAGANGTYLVDVADGRISNISNTPTITITTAAPHGLFSGDTVTIQNALVTGGTISSTANGTWVIANATGGPDTTFDLVGAPAGNGVYDTVNTTGTWFDAKRFTLLGSSGTGAYTSGGVWSATSTTDVIDYTLGDDAQAIEDGLEDILGENLTSGREIGVVGVDADGDDVPDSYNITFGGSLTGVDLPNPALFGTVLTTPISGASNAAPIVIQTADTTGLSNGVFVIIENVGGNTAANGTWEIAGLTATSFQLVGSNGLLSGGYTPGTGTWRAGNIPPLVTLVNGAPAIMDTLIEGGSDIDIPLRWFSIGPAPINNSGTFAANVGHSNMPTTGRVTSVASEPTDPNVIYIATAGGGAWKTINGGVSWAPLFDGINEVQDVAVTAPGTGTFRLAFGGDQTIDIPFDATSAVVEAALNALAAVNLLGGSFSVAKVTSSSYRVTFSGGGLAQTDWPLLGGVNVLVTVRADGVNADAALFAGAIAIAPSLPSTIYLGTGEASNSNDSYYGTGIYKSTDSGRTWSLLNDLSLPDPNPLYKLAVSDIVVDPFNPNLIYAAVSDLAINGLRGVATTVFNATAGFNINVDEPTVRNAGVWRYNGSPGVGTWINLTNATSPSRRTFAGFLGFDPPQKPGPDDDYRYNFPQANAAWSDLKLVYMNRDEPFTSARPVPLFGPVLYAALGTPNGGPTGTFDDDWQGGALPVTTSYNSNAVFRTYMPDSTTAIPVWYVGTPGQAQSEIQRVTIARTNTTFNGDYELGYADQAGNIQWTSTLNMSIGASSAIVQLAINALLASLGITGTVTVSAFGPLVANVTNLTYTLSFGGNLANSNQPEFLFRAIPIGQTSPTGTVSDNVGVGTQPGGGVDDRNRFGQPFPAGPFAASGVPTGVPNNGNIKFDVHNTGVLSTGLIYAAITSPNGQLRGLVRSIDGGGDWDPIPPGPTTPPSPPNTGGEYMGTVPTAAGNYASTVQFDPLSGGSRLVVASVGQPLTGGLWESNNAQAATAIGAVAFAPTVANTGDANGNGPHVDFHSVAFDSNRNLIVGTDGGVWRMVGAPAGAKTWSNLNGDLAITQFNGIATHPNDPTLAIGGTQSNGTVQYTGNLAWNRTAFGNGGAIIWDRNNEGFAYSLQRNLNTQIAAGVSPVWNLHKSVDGGFGWGAGPIFSNINSFAMDPVTTSEILVGQGANLFRSTNSGVSFGPALGPFGTGVIVNLIAPAGYQGTFAFDASFPGVFDIKAGSIDTETFYVTDGSTIRLTKNLGTTWVTRSVAGLRPMLSGTTIADMIVDPNNRDTVYVTTIGATGGRIFNVTNNGTLIRITTVGAHNLVDGDKVTIRGVEGVPGANAEFVIDQINATTFDLNGSTFSGTYAPNTGDWSPRERGRVFKTTTAGADPDAGGPLSAWEDISAGLPDLPAWSIVIDPRSGDLYLGNDRGVWQRQDALGVWQRFGIALPNTQVRDLHLNLETNILTAGTYGRSAFQFHLDQAKPNSGALRVLGGVDNNWQGPVIFTGDTTITADGEQGNPAALAAVLSIDGQISDADFNGDYVFTKDGNGEIILTNINTYGGETHVINGILDVVNPQALGESGPAQGTEVSDGAALEVSDNVELEPLTLIGHGFLDNDHFAGALRNAGGDNVYTGPITLLGDVTIGVNQNTTLTIGAGLGLKGAGSITDGGATFDLIKELQGTLILNTLNSNDGGVTINQGILQLQHSNALGNFNARPAVVVDDAQLQLQATLLGAITNASNPANPIVITTQSPHGLATGAQVTISDVQGNLAANGTYSIIKLSDTTFSIPKIGNGNYVANTGTWTPTIPVPITIKDWLLNLTGAGFQGGGGALLNTGGSNTWDGNVILAFRPAFNPDSFPPGVTSIGVANGSDTLTIDGQIDEQSPVGVRKVGTGKLLLKQANTYSGATYIDTGILAIQNALGLGGNSANEMQRIVVTRPPAALGGSFTLTFGVDSTTLPFNTPANGVGSVESALNALPSITSAGGVTVAGGSILVDGQTYWIYTVTFVNTADQAEISAVGVPLSGALAEADTVADGGLGTLVANGAALELDGSLGTVAGEALLLNGTGVTPADAGALRNLSGNNIWTGPVTLGTGSPVDDTSIGVDGASRLTIQGVVRDPVATPPIADLFKVGTGTLVFTAANTYSGQTTVEEGVLNIQHDQALGLTQDEIQHIVVTGSSGTFSIAFEAPNGVTDSTGNLTFGAPDTAVQTALNNLRSIGANEVQTIDVAGSGGDTFKLVFRGEETGDIAFNASTTTVENQLIALNAIPTGGVAVTGSPGDYTITFVGGLAGFNQPNISSTDVSPGATIVHHNFETPGGDTTVRNGGVGGSVTVVKTGNDYEITFGGTLAGINVNNLIPSDSGPSITASQFTEQQGGLGGTFVLDGAGLEVQNNITVASEALTLNGTGPGNAGALENVADDNIWNGPITIGAIGATIGVDNAGETLTISSEIDGTGGVTKVGPGILRYTASNSYAGDTTVDGGFLVLDFDNAASPSISSLSNSNLIINNGEVTWEESNQVADINDVTVNAGGLMNLNNRTEEISTLTINGGTARTGLSAGILTVSTLDMTGGILTINGTVNLGAGGVIAGSSATDVSAVINRTEAVPDGTLNMGAATRTFNIIDQGVGATENRLQVFAPIIGGAGVNLIKTGPGIMEINEPSTPPPTYLGLTRLDNGTLLVNGVIGNVQLNDTNFDAVLGGTGTVGNITSPTNGGIVNPGTSPGQLTVNGTVTWTNEVTFFVEINGGTQGTDYDYLAVSGAVNLGNATLDGSTTGFTATGGQIFTILTGASVIGNFRDASGNLLNDGDRVTLGGRYSVDYTPTSVRLIAIAYTPTVNPATTPEETMSTTPPDLVITPNPNDGGEVTHYRITNILNGRLFLANGTTEIFANTGATTPLTPANGFITVAQGQPNGLRFLPDDDFFGLTTFDITAYSQTEDVFDVTVVQAQITVTNVNDAPVLDVDASPTLTTVNHSDDFALNDPLAGNTVAQIVVDGSISDADGSPVEAMAIIAADTSNGVWRYDLAVDGYGTWLPFPAVSSGSALLLGPLDKILFDPTLNFSGSPTPFIRFHAWDMSPLSGSPGGTADLSFPGATGGNTAFSEFETPGWDTATITVNNPNNAAPELDINANPVLAPIPTSSIPLTSPDPYLGTVVSGIVVPGSISDVDVPPDPAVTAIAVWWVDNTNGRWEYSLDGGTNWLHFSTNPNPGAVRNLNDTGAGELGSVLLGGGHRVRFRPNVGFNGTSSMRFHAWDMSPGSGVAGGRVDLDGITGGTSGYSALEAGDLLQGLGFQAGWDAATIQVGTTTVLTSSSPVAVFGANVIFQATVTAGTGGSVTFTAQLTTAPFTFINLTPTPLIPNGFGVAQVSVDDLPGGTWTITATFTGSPSSSSDSETQHILEFLGAGSLMLAPNSRTLADSPFPHDLGPSALIPLLDPTTADYGAITSLTTTNLESVYKDGAALDNPNNKGFQEGNKKGKIRPFNFKGMQEKWIFSNPDVGKKKWHIIVVQNDQANVYLWKGKKKTLLQAPVGTFDVSTWYDPSELYDAFDLYESSVDPWFSPGIWSSFVFIDAPPAGAGPVNPAADASDVRLQIDPQVGFSGKFRAEISLTVGSDTTKTSFVFEILNTPPVIDEPATTPNLPRNTPTDVVLTFSDAENDDIVHVQTTAVSAAYLLDVEHKFEINGSLRTNLLFTQGKSATPLQEHWLWSKSEKKWYILVPSDTSGNPDTATLYKWTGKLSTTLSNGPVMVSGAPAVLDGAYWIDPSKLWNAEVNGNINTTDLIPLSPTNPDIDNSGDTITITFNPSPSATTVPSGTYFVTIKIKDVYGAFEEMTFAVNVV